MNLRLARRRASDDLVLGELVALSYELLDAHADTIELATCREPGVRWDAHVDYLRALQRVGRSLLARSCSGEER